MLKKTSTNKLNILFLFLIIVCLSFPCICGAQSANNTNTTYNNSSTHTKRFVFNPNTWDKLFEQGNGTVYVDTLSIQNDFNAETVKANILIRDAVINEDLLMNMTFFIKTYSYKEHYAALMNHRTGIVKLRSRMDDSKAKPLSTENITSKVFDLLKILYKYDKNSKAKN